MLLNYWIGLNLIWSFDIVFFSIDQVAGNNNKVIEIEMLPIMGFHIAIEMYDIHYLSTLHLQSSMYLKFVNGLENCDLDNLPFLPFCIRYILIQIL
jgi:hypothetical protein